jgi:hypothetical protein
MKAHVIMCNDAPQAVCVGTMAEAVHRTAILRRADYTLKYEREMSYEEYLHEYRWYSKPVTCYGIKERGE